jgi:fructose-1,6-bisphosphatase
MHVTWQHRRGRLQAILNDAESVLDVVIDDLDKRLGVCFGSKGEVEKYKQFML